MMDNMIPRFNVGDTVIEHGQTEVLTVTRVYAVVNPTAPHVRLTCCGAEPYRIVDACQDAFAKDGIEVGPQEPPQDYRIYNRRWPDGTFPPTMEFFDRSAERTT